jgi:hypothetical protein
MNMQKTAAILTILAGLAGASAATAAPIAGLFNTDAALAPDGAIDPNWLVSGNPTFVYNHPSYLTDPAARFIAVQAGGGYSNATNTFTLSFDLTGFNPLTASLSGQFASDNWADAYLNGNLLAAQPHITDVVNFTTLTAFSASGVDFINGINTLSFIVTDTGPPSALFVKFLTSDVLASTAPIPEPFTLSLFGAGLAGAVALRRRKSAKVA